MDNIFLRSWHSHRDRNDLRIPSKEIAVHPPVARSSLRAIMTHLISVARSDTPACDPLASFRRQPAPDFPGGGFTIDVIGVCHLYPGPGGWAAIFASGAEISGGGSATTSDQMYILAATRALDATPIGAIVDVLTSSNLLAQVQRGASARRGNADLWRALDQACALRQVTFNQIKEGEIAVRALAETEYEHQADGRTAALLPSLSHRPILGTYIGVAP